MRSTGLLAKRSLAFMVVSVLISGFALMTPARGANTKSSLDGSTGTSVMRTDLKPFGPAVQRADLSAVAGATTTADLQNGDLLIGAATELVFGNPSGIAIFRLRGTSITKFCEGPIIDGYGAEYFGVPTDVIVDSNGRVVFLARIPGPSFGNYGLFRCDRMGATPTRLVDFAHETSTNAGWPMVVSDISAQSYSVTGLHLARERTPVIHDGEINGVPRIITQDVYGLGVGFAAGFNPLNSDIFQTVKSVRYHPDTGELDLDGPAISHVDNGRSTPDIAFHRGMTYSVDSDALRRTKDAMKLHISGTAGGTVFSAKLSLFGRSDEIRGIIVDDLNEPNVDSGCRSPQPANVSTLMPPVLGGLANLYSVVFDESGSLGLVIASNNGFVRTPYLTEVSEALLDNPRDYTQYFTMPGLNCAPMPTVQFRSILPFLTGVVKDI